jgi:hypothetical protein
MLPIYATKIYAFLGIAKDGYEILPDYGALVEDVDISDQGVHQE